MYGSVPKRGVRNGGRACEDDLENGCHHRSLQRRARITGVTPESQSRDDALEPEDERRRRAHRCSPPTSAHIVRHQRARPQQGRRSSSQSPRATTQKARARQAEQQSHRRRHLSCCPRSCPLARACYPGPAPAAFLTGDHCCLHVRVDEHEHKHALPLFKTCQRRCQPD